MKRKLVIIALGAALIVLSGCTDEKAPNNQQPAPTAPNQQPTQPAEPTQPQPQPQQPTTPNDGQAKFHASIAGISLGDSLEKVESILGKDYKETSFDEMGYFPEPWLKREYSEGFTVIYGKDSRKIFEMETTNSNYKTDLGAKVGDKATDVFNIYGSKYQQFESRHGYGKLEGFYILENQEVIIFDLHKGDNSIVNEKAKPDDKIELIRITREHYLD